VELILSLFPHLGYDSDMTSDESRLNLARRVDISIGGLYEVIVSTSDPNGRPHAAPMGALFSSHDSFVMRSYGETTTLRNLRTSGRGALNVVDDVLTFFNCVFRPYRLSFKWSDGIPLLRKACAWLIFELEEVIDRGQYYEMRCSVLDVKALKTRPRPICRAEASLLEALIHYTRIKYYVSVNRKAEARELSRLIDHHLSIVERTGWPELKRIAKDLRRNVLSLPLDTWWDATLKRHQSPLT